MSRHKHPSAILWIEGIGFGFFLVLAWISEFVDMPHLLFALPSSSSWARLVVKTVLVVSVWAAVHLATRRLLKRLHYLEEFLLVCSWCRKIGHEGNWKTTEDYFGTAFRTETSHGVCQECSQRLFTAIAREPFVRAEGLPMAKRVSSKA